MKRRDFIKLSSAGAIGTAVIDSNASYLIATGLMENKPADARIIWYSKSGEGRNLFGSFRRSFTLNGTVQKASLCLFADTVYQLYVNGVFVEFGPVRFDPRFPQYDTHDISKHLKPGKNVIAVSVNYYGMKVFRSMMSSGGMLSWGEIKTDKETVSLISKPGNWKCIPNKAYSKFASKLSFALNARDIFDQALEEKNWQMPSFDDSKWPAAVELTNQKIWGTPSPRSIPFMSGEKIAIPSVKHILPIVKNEDLYSFTLSFPEFFTDIKGENKGFIAYSTWIYSPRKQNVSVGTFWGEHWLNGKEIPKGVVSENKSMRINQQWELNEGWNFFFGKVGAYADAVHVFFGFPKNRGIVVSADKQMESDYSFRHLAVLKNEDIEKFVKNKPLPYSPDDLCSELGGWTMQKKSDQGYDPCKETSWDDLGEQAENLSPEEINGHVFTTDLYPDGVSILFDMDYIRFAFPVIDIEGVKGASIDLTYSEHIAPDDQHLLFSFNYTGGDRVFCSEDRINWTPGNPRGMRYFMLTIRNIKNDIRIHDVHLRSAHYPVKKTGSFNSSDELLNAVWEAGALTQSVNMTDAYVDCVGREQGMYGRDTIIQYHNNLAVFGDQALMGRCMELFGQSPDETGKFRAVFPNTGDYTIADFALNMVEGYLAYYQHSNDKQRIVKDWGVIQKNLDWFHQLADERSDLLLDSEWDKKRKMYAHYGGFHGDLDIKTGYMDNTGIHCVFSCTYLIAIRCAIELAKAIGKPQDAQALQKRADVLTQSIQKFWDADKKAFADNLSFTTHSHHASLFAVRAGAVKPEQISEVKKHVAAELRSIFVNGYDPKDGNLTSPAFAFYIFDGLYKLGLAKTAEDMMRIGWGWFLFKGCKTIPEYFTFRSSLCHAWSASPTYYLSKNVLGIQFPKAPDLNYVEIRVQTHHVTFAEGTYPHPKGVIEVKWHTDDAGKRVFDVVKGPEGVEVKVIS